MNKNLSVVIAVTLILGTGVIVAVRQIITNPNRVDAVAHRIADFDLPLGYETDYVVEALDYAIATYISADGQTHLSFMQAPDGVFHEDTVLAGYIPSTGRHDDWGDATLISTGQLIIRDHPATLTVSERINGEGVLYRSANLVFQGRSGTALLVINQPASEWTDAFIESFIASIH
ncbi:MAG: hypothetical protein K8L99_31050 [Anaerolineae bacterium]|nr:hypothetical protein [Anaerolineae bacterium]